MPSCDRLWGLLKLARMYFCIMICLQAFGDQGLECGGLNENVLYRLIGTGTLRRCGLAGKSVSLGVDFEVSDAQAGPSIRFSLFLPPADPDGKLLSPSAPGLPVCHHASCHDDDELNL